MKSGQYPPPDVIADPARTQPLAFDSQKRDFVTGVHRAQTRVEFKTVDDPDFLAEPDMFRSQVAMTIDNGMLPNTFGQNGCPLLQESQLHGFDTGELPCGQPQ